jgi:hypothetical protein
MSGDYGMYQQGSGSSGGFADPSAGTIVRAASPGEAGPILTGAGGGREFAGPTGDPYASMTGPTMGPEGGGPQGMPGPGASNAPPSQGGGNFAKGGGEKEAARGYSSPQDRVTAEYRSLGLRWGRPPTYDPRLQDFGEIGPRGVRIGRLALRSRSVLRSTLIHEGTHYGQIKSGNYAIGGTVAGLVNEAEALRQELMMAEQSGLSQRETEYVAGRYWKVLENLFQSGRLGHFYLMRMLVYGNFALRPQDAYTGPVWGWVK